MISCCLNRVQAAVIPLLLVPMLSFAQGRGRNGLQIFITHCAVCHRSNSGTRAPLPEVLQQMPREAIVRALEMPPWERRARMQALHRRAAGRDVLAWASSILDRLERRKGQGFFAG